VDTQRLVLKVRVHSARGWIGMALSCCWTPPHPIASRLSHLWLDAGYNGQDKGADWVHKVVGWTAEIVVGHPPKLVPDEVMRIWVREWDKERVHIDWEKLQAPKRPRAFLPRRWIVERTISWLGQNRRMSKDYERLPQSAEALIYVAMSRLMLRRLARS
jgi:putative transposase